MTTEEDSPIKSGVTIVADFISGLKGQEQLDADTVTSIQALHAKGKLTKTNLVRALEERRSSTKARNPNEDQ
jgi:hypothetical protein